VWLIISIMILIMALFRPIPCPKLPQRPPAVFNPAHRTPYEVYEEISISSDPSDFEIVAAFVKVNEAKRGMEGSDDGKGGEKVKEVISDGSDDIE
jgi:hypothetical protein